jgi:transposase
MAMIPPGQDVKRLEPIECTREAWRQRWTELPPDAQIALEVSTRGYFVMSVLEEEGWRERAHWVHTAGIDSLRKQKSDRLDPRRLVKKLTVHDVEPLPEAWFPPPPLRALRLLARQRCVFTIKGRAWIQPPALSAAAQLCFQRLFRLYDFLSAEREISEAERLAAAAAFPQVALLRTIPGLGHLLAAVVWSEIGDLGRFDSADALANYTGAVPSSYDSGEVSVHGPITRQGPVWLRGALVTAANALTRSKSPLGQRSGHLRRCHQHPHVAKTAVAGSVARCV